MSDNPTILQAVDCDGSIVKIHKGFTSWCWQYQSNKRHEFYYGWTDTEADAVSQSKTLLKPDETGKYPEFQVVEVEK